jgi:hypothetical protein
VTAHVPDALKLARDLSFEVALFIGFGVSFCYYLSKTRLVRGSFVGGRVMSSHPCTVSVLRVEDNNSGDISRSCPINSRFESAS